MSIDVDHLIAEQFAAEAVAEIMGTFFRHLPPSDVPLVQQALRGPILTAAVAAVACTRPTGYRRLTPSVN